MIYVVSGPSGCGKSTLIKNLLSRLPGLQFSVSHTTRPRRPNEINGRDYYFVSREKFQEMKEAGAFLEWAVVHNEFYGTSWDEIKQKGNRGDLVLDIDVQGAKQVKKKANPHLRKDFTGTGLSFTRKLGVFHQPAPAEENCGRVKKSFRRCGFAFFSYSGPVAASAAAGQY